MYAFAGSASLTAAKPALASSFTAAPVCSRPSSNTTAPTMILRVSLRRPVGTAAGVFNYGGVATILDKADTYFAYSVKSQYLNMTNPTGEFSVSCTEGAVKGAAEAARIRVLGNQFRAAQASPSKKYYDLYENRKNAVSADHNCRAEEDLYVDYPKLCAGYNLAKAEAYGTCSRYATPETIEEAAMLRYMDIQQNIAANPTGVYNTYCNEGSSKGQAEEIRVAALNAAFRQGQKPLGVVLQEKYNQRKYGYGQCHSCNYEEGLVSNYPAIGAAFRSRSYGY